MSFKDILQAFFFHVLFHGTDVDADALRELSCLVSEVDGIYVPFFINSCRSKSSETVLLTIDGINSEQEAIALVNHDIYALKTEFRQASEENDADGYPLDYFIGYERRSGWIRPRLPD